MNQQSQRDANWKELSDRIYELYECLTSELGNYTRDQPDEQHFVERLLAGLKPFFIWGLFKCGRAPLHPIDISELKQLINEPDTAVLAFAFGLTSDGRPGISNENMAEVICDLSPTDWGKVYVQWEIADALSSLDNVEIPPDCIAWPPQFKSVDIKDPYQLAIKLYFSGDDVIRYVYECLPENIKKAIENWAKVPGNSSTEVSKWLVDVLVYGLNKLLENPTFHQQISQTLRLRQLKRDLSFEVRELPDPSATLGKGQAIRVNRFILEALFPDELAEGKYLSSLDVLDAVLDKMKAAGIKKVILVANPGHMFRCKELLELTAYNKQMRNLNVLIADCTGVRYDPNSAQSWTRSEGEFWRYDILSRGRELLQWQVLKKVQNL